MNVRSVAQTAALLGWFGSHSDYFCKSTFEATLSEYWKCSRALFRYWTNHLNEHRRRPKNLLGLSIFAEEILVSELLTRVMSAKLLLISDFEKNEAAAKIAFNTMRDHDQSRLRVLELIDRHPHGVSTFLRCQRLARKIERWSDLIISPLTKSESAIHASYDQERCLDFGDEWASPAETRKRLMVFHIQYAALTMFLPKQQLQDPAIAGLHMSRCESALAFVSPGSASVVQGFQLDQCNSQFAAEIARHYPAIFGMN